MEKQGEAFTRAALKRVGVDASRATPEVIEEAFTRVGQQFDGLAARNKIVPDGKLAQDMGDAVKKYFRLVRPGKRAPVVQSLVQDLGDVFKRGPLDGAAYQATRSQLTSDAASAPPPLQELLFGIRNALDDAMDRSIAKYNPSDAGLWRDARNTYRNLMVVEQAATGAGEGAASGLISPRALRQEQSQTHHPHRWTG